MDLLHLILSRNTIALTNKTSQSHKVIIFQAGTVSLVVNGSIVSEGIHKSRCIEHILQGNNVFIQAFMDQDDPTEIVSVPTDPANPVN